VHPTKGTHHMSSYKRHVVRLANHNELNLVDTPAIEHDISYYDSGVLRIVETTYSRPDPEGKREFEARRTWHYAPHAWVNVATTDI